ncbi:MAG TPA: fructosamine kinase, partial [Rhodospirillales bacterium]|nr:fructosamine kinase [Rhodospirillales bacterium]
RDQRLIYMAEEAVKSGSLKPSSLSRIETLCAQLDRWLLTPVQASLIHGDMWGGNILCKDGRIAGFVDPAIYYADPEIELAFSTLFDTFGSPFFNRYAEHRPFLPGFFEERRDIYNLYPLLVHLNLFGGSYAARVEATLTRFGF